MPGLGLRLPTFRPCTPDAVSRFEGWRLSALGIASGVPVVRRNRHVAFRPTWPVATAVPSGESAFLRHEGCIEPWLTHALPTDSAMLEPLTGSPPDRRLDEPGRRILLAEDDTQFRSLLATALRRDGHQVVEASDGFELVHWLATGTRSGAPLPFDLVISDIRMPGWSGMEVLAAMKRLGRVPPFLLITAFGDDQVEREARDLGAIATLSKPFDIDDLRAVVSAAVPSGAPIT
jgi:CheY-like chemotaxis protein